MTEVLGLDDVASKDIDVLVAMLNRGVVEDAERGARALLREHPQAGILWKILGAALMAQGKEALEAQRKTAELMPADAEAHAILGAALQDRGRWEEAVASYRTSLELDAGSPAVQNNLGNLLAANGQCEAAIECLQRALQLNSDDAETHSNLGNALRRAGRPTEAIASCRRAIRLDPRLSAAHVNLGLGLSARGHFEEAVASLRRGIQLDPRNPVAVAALGNAWRDLGDLRQAVSCYLQAVELDPTRAATYYDLGNAMMELGRLEEAATSYAQVLALQGSHEAARLNLCMVLRQRGRAAEAETLCRAALEKRPDSAEALTMLGELRADRGQFSEAQELFQRAVSLNPDLPVAWSLIAAHKKMSADATWLHGVERLLAGRPPLRHEIRLRYALGKYFDDIESYEQAFENFRLANELSKRYGVVYDRAGHAREVDEIIHRFDAEFMRREADRCDSTRPVFIIGMPRSGTSLAEQILAAHPAVFGAGELDFWDRASAAYRERKADTLTALGKEYLDRLQGLSGNALRVVDKMPANFMNVGLIHAVFPNARIIHMRRSPLDTCLSIYFHYFSRSHTHANDFDDLAHYYAEYVRLMDHWRAVLPATSLLEVPYEALLEDQERWTRRMLEFLGLPWDPKCLTFHEAERVVITASRWQVRQRINTSSVGRWRHYASFVGGLRGLAT